MKFWQIVKKVVLWVLSAFCFLCAILFWAMRNDPLAQGTEGDGKLLVQLAVAFLVVAFVLGWLALGLKERRSRIAREKVSQYREARLAALPLMTTLPVVEYPQSVVLQPGETCHFQSDASVVQFKEEIVGYTGGSGGVSVRVAKGVTIHSGRSRSRAIRQKVAKTYPGIFTITNQRIIMTGEKSFSQPVLKLTAIDPWNGLEGISLQFGSHQYVVQMLEPYMVAKILDLLIAKMREGLHGRVGE